MLILLLLIPLVRDHVMSVNTVILHLSFWKRGVFFFFFENGELSKCGPLSSTYPTHINIHPHV